MKKLILALVIFLSLQSCATIMGGKVTDCQLTKPAPGEPRRHFRYVAILADLIIFPPLVIVDYATKAIYKPCK